MDEIESTNAGLMHAMIKVNLTCLGKTTALFQSLTWTTEDSLKNFLRRPLRKVRSIKA